MSGHEWGVSLPDNDTNLLEAVKLAEALERKINRNLVWTGYGVRVGALPYPSQMKCHNSMKRLIALLGGNQCLGEETMIFDPVAGVSRRVGEITEPFHVESWDGAQVIKAEASIPFIKATEDLYEFTFEDGQTFVATEAHLVLTPHGWLPIGLVQQLGFELCLPGSTLGIAQSTHREDAPRSTDIVQGSQSDCPSCPRSDDGLPHAAQASGQGVLPSLGGALEHKWASSLIPETGPLGDSHGIQGSTHSCPLCVPPSSLGALGLTLAPAVETSRRIEHRPWIPVSDLLRDGQRLLGGSIPQSQPIGGSDRRAIHSPSRSSIALSGSLITSKQRIKQKVWKRKGNVYDFEVPATGNYLLAGAVHHNSGKSHSAACQMAWDLTGEYPEWYTGVRTTQPIKAWVVGESFTTLRETCQDKLFGKLEEGVYRGGMIPEDLFAVAPTRIPNTGGVIDTIGVRHKSGGISYLTQKTYAQGREALQGFTGHRIWIDEEPPQDCWDELMMRVIAKRGRIYVTFTPLSGFTPLYTMLTTADPDAGIDQHFLGWDQATHLDEAAKAEIRAQYRSNPAQLEARMTGHATIATGMIFPFPLADIICPTFKPDAHWPRGGGLDFGWRHPTAAVEFAKDPATGDIYICNEYRVSERTVDDHVKELMVWGDIDFGCDPAGMQVEKSTGVALMEMYADLMQPDWRHLPESQRKIFRSENDRALGIDRMHRAMQNGKFFIMAHCTKTQAEYSQYHYDEHGKIHAFNDDLMTAWRYGLMAEKRWRVPGRWRGNPLLGTIQKVEQWKPPGGRGY